MFRTIAFAITLCVLPYAYVNAQACNGSQGDPVFLENFGSGTIQLPAYKSHFKYMNGCPKKSFYTLDDFLFGCGDRTWAQLIGDHTRNERGNYMLVNAENEKGIVYQDTAKNLCGNTLYQFNVWATGVMTKYACGGNPVLPEIQFKITDLTGNLLAGGSTGKIPIVVEKEWKSFGASFRTAAGGTLDAIITLSIDAPYGCGSGFAIDDISLSACGPQLSARLNGGTEPLDICSDYTNPLVLSAVYSDGFLDPVVQWQSSSDTGRTWTDIAGQTALTYSIPHRDSGVVMYRIALAERSNINSLKCRINSNTLYTSIHPAPEHKAPQNDFGCLGKDYFFPTISAYATDALWRGPNGFVSTSAKASIPAIQYNAEGLYTLKQNFIFGCSSLDTLYLSVFPASTITIQPARPLCEGETEQLFASSTDNNVSYQWTPSSGLSNSAIPNPVASPKDSTLYKVIITNQYGCKDSATLQIDVYRNPSVAAGPDKTILTGDTAVLNGKVTGTAVNYYWTPDLFLSSGTATAPQAFPPQSGTYRLHAESTVGCGSVNDAVNVTVYSSFAIPNAFTPNNDGRNDKFQILALDNYKLVHLYIYDRGGHLVFKSEGVYNGWDGNYKGLPQPAGVYVYHLEMLAPSRGRLTQKGTITLVR